MPIKPVVLFILVVMLSLSANCLGIYDTDNFNTPHNYLTQGVAGTIWSGFLGLNTGETVDILDASTTKSGELYMASTGAYWTPPWNPLGPFLYRVVDADHADFIAIVKVTDYAGTEAVPVYHNNCGLMARASKSPDQAGTGEDWVSIDYFPIYSCGNYVRSADDDTRYENCHNGLAWSLNPYLKLEKVGSFFHFSTSPDGSVWTEMPCSPLQRTDMNGIPLQVGLFHGTYNTTQGYAAFDNFSLEANGRLIINQTNGTTEVYESADPPNDTYTVALSIAPASNVTVNISHDDQIEVNPSSLLFTSSNYATPKTVTVTAVDNTYFDGVRTSVITHSTATSDQSYQNISEFLSVTVFDNDRFGDFTGDGYIDAADIEFLLDRWLDNCGLDSYCDGADLTGIIGLTPNPGRVDNQDIAVFAPHWQEGSLLITEFMASNNGDFKTMVNGISASPDWIEIYNASPGQINLQGWRLTDNLNNLSKWTFPSRSLFAGQYIVVFASGQDSNDFVDDLGYLHTNFKLDADGGDLALVAPDGKVYYQYINYPNQKTNCSYGFKDLRWGYFAVATPLTTNGTIYSDYVRDTKFDTNRGFFDNPFDVEITTDTPGATIRYTTDGNAPTMTVGSTYTSPIQITKTTFLRAAAFKDDFIPSDVDTQTYIFLNDLWTQTRPAGYPTQTYDPANPLDYAIDQDVIGPANLFGNIYRNTFISDLKALPSLSIVMNVNSLFGPVNGIYSHSTMEGDAWERAASIEMIDPNNEKEFQVNAAIRMQGGYGANAFEQPKHNFRIIFKRPYGPTTLDYKIFDDTNVHEFDELVVRTTCHDSWLTNQTYFRREGLYAKDQWHRAIQRAMGHVSIHGQWVHVYLNGLYWGIYELVERPSQAFAASYFGGDKEQYDAIGSGTARGTSTLDAWNTMNGIANGDIANNAVYLQLQQYLDVVNLADYIIYNVYSAISDWPGWNYYAARKKEAGSQFRIFSWDSEASMMSDRLNYNKLTDIDAGPGHLYKRLKLNAEFKLLFADRLYRHLKNTGVLTPAKAAQIFQNELKRVEPGLGPESARWGDSWESTPLTKADWLADQAFLFNTFFPQRADIVLNLFKTDGVYPATSAPYFNQHGGQISPGFSLTITNPNGLGTIYYTLNGTDPRESYTGNIVGTAYSGSITLNTTTQVKARVKNGSDWSALCEAVFDTGLVKNSLRITEIMYHPLDTGSASDPNTEFIELRNIGAQAINLNMVSFTEGINYTFPNINLAAGQYAVLVTDQPAFQAKYPTITPTGVYTGKLENAGERIRLQDALGNTILDFSYKDGWCDNTDGDGYSLTINNETNPDPNSWGWKQFWSASTYINGSPGTGDTGPRWGDVVINEVLAHSHDISPDWIELHNTTGNPINITGWFLSNSKTDLTKYQIPNTTIPANGFVVFTQANHFGAYFALSENGDHVYLTGKLDNYGNLTGYRQAEDFGASERNIAFGRYYKGSTNDYDFVSMSQNTPGSSFQGAPNAYPKVGPIVISEIMYNPTANSDAEYIELYNNTDSRVNLYDANNNGWKITEGVVFTFPQDANISAYSYMVLAKNLAVFNAAYSTPAGIQKLQWTSGGLNNDGEKVEISMPGDVNDSGILQYIRIDRVNYSDGWQNQNFYNIPDPWPVYADGYGYSLTKVNYALYGNDPNAWAAYSPSPGQAGSPPTPPSKATSPNPSHGATGRPITQILSWSNGGGATSYDVYFGTDSTPDETEFKVNTTGTSYNPGTLLNGTTYYWRIDAKNPAGTTTGDVWSFITEALTFDLLVDLNANGLSLGTLTTWTNTGTLGGSFGNQGTTPTVETVNGIKAVTFDGSTDKLMSSFTAPSAITSNHAYTVAVWVYNPSIADEECLVNWAHRGGPEGTCAQLNYGSNASYGAVTHWNTPDMGFDGGIPTTAVWHHIAVTFDGATEKVYVDGILNATEAKTLNMYTGDPIYLGYAFGDGNYKWFSGSMASVKMYNYTLTAEEIITLSNDSTYWTTLTTDNFEAGTFGNYTSGGTNAKIYTYSTGTNFAHQGTKAADIESVNADVSSFWHTTAINVDTPGYKQIKVDFWYMPVSMETGEDFWVMYYDGTTWQTIKQYISGTDFSNNAFYHAILVIKEGAGAGFYTFPTTMKIKFRCDASNTSDDVYIDEVKVMAK